MKSEEEGMGIERKGRSQLLHFNNPLQKKKKKKKKKEEKRKKKKKKKSTKKNNNTKNENAKKWNN